MTYTDDERDALSPPDLDVAQLAGGDDRTVTGSVRG